MDNNHDSTTENRYQRVIDLQIQLQEIEGVAKLAGETCDDVPFAGTLGVIERRVESIREQLNDLLPGDATKDDAATKDHAATAAETDDGEESDADGYQEDPFDALTLVLSHARNVIQAMMDAEMAGEKRDLVGLGAMARDQVDAARRICMDDLHKSRYWKRKSVGGAA